MSCLYFAREMGQPTDERGSLVAQSRFPEQAVPGSQVLPSGLQEPPTFSPLAGSHKGAPVGVLGSRQTGGPQVAYHFRPSAGGHVSMPETQLPLTHLEKGQAWDPSAHVMHAIWICGQSVSSLHGPPDPASTAGQGGKTV